MRATVICDAVMLRCDYSTSRTVHAATGCCVNARVLLSSVGYAGSLPAPVRCSKFHDVHDKNVSLLSLLIWFHDMQKMIHAGVDDKTVEQENAHRTLRIDTRRTLTPCSC